MQATITLNIFTNNRSEMLGTLELTDHGEFPLALTWSTGDFTDITKRSGSYSKTFKVPASKLNSRILAYIYQVGINFYNVYAACQAEVLHNGIPFFRGKLKINNVSQHGQPSEYELELIGENLDWVEYMKNHSVRDIDYGNRNASYFNDELSELANVNAQTVAATTKSHPYTEGYAIASWSNFPEKFDFVYGLKSYGAWRAGNKVIINDLRPDVSIAHIVTEAFRKAGYRLQSSFCSADFFKRLVLAFTGDAFTKAANAHDNMLFKSVLCTPKEFNNLGSGFNTGLVALPMPPCAGAFDNGNNFAAGKYTVPAASIQRFYVSATVEMNNWHENLRYLGIGIGRLTPNGISTIIEEPVGFDNNGQIKSITVDTGFLQCMPAEQIVVYTLVKTHAWSFPNLANKSPRFKVLQLEFFNEITAEITEGATYEVSQVLPDIKLIEVLTGVMNMFNLYFKTDPVNKQVYCEPRDQFLKPLSESLDWTAKFDVAKGAEIQYLDDYKRELTFKYKLDTHDAFLKHRAETTKQNPGSLVHSLPEKYTPGKHELGVKNFAYSLTFQDEQIIHPFNSYNAAPEIPRLWSELSPYPDVSYGFAPRIMYYEGCVAKTLTNRTGNQAPVSWHFGNQPSYRNKYPLLTVAPPHYGTVAGLVNNYYKNTIAQIEDGRQVVAYFQLGLTDILNLDLQKPIFINHHTLKGYYYITTIADYRPAQALPVKITLLPALTAGHADIDLTNQADYSAALLGPTLGRGSGMATLDNSAHLGQLRDTPATVLHNGTGNWAPAGTGAIAIGQGAMATARNQTVLGAYNVTSDSDIVQVGGGTTHNDRYRALTFTHDGNFLVQGGYLYTTDGREIMFASQRSEHGQPKRFDKLHLKGNR